ncbi:unnamed protein product, partial [Didymodactylos carnosus]
IDQAAQQYLSQVPIEAKQAQAKRDHNSFHISVVTKEEFQVKTLECKQLLQQPLSPAESQFIVVGLGKQSLGDNRVWFVIAYWHGGRKIRQSLSLPMIDFHITLGFEGVDVFDVRKNLRTLIYHEQSLDTASTLLQYAHECFSQREYALELCSAGLQLLPPDNQLAFSLLSLRSLLYGQLKQYSNCMVDAEKMLELHSTSQIAHSRIANACVYLKDYTRAHATFIKYLKLMKKEHTKLIIGVTDEDESSITENELERIHRGLRYCSQKINHAVICEDSRERVTVSVLDARLCTTELFALPVTVTLARNFSWILPGTLTAMSIPRNAAHMIALEYLNIGLIVTAMSEGPLKDELFPADCIVQQMHIPTVNYKPPALEEVASILLQL